MHRSRAMAGLLLLATVAGGCTAAQRDVTRVQSAARKIVAENTACMATVTAKPEYAVLLPHTADQTTGRATMAQLTDETLPTRAEGQLLAARYDDWNVCLSHTLSEMEAVAPAFAAIYADGLTASDATMVPLIEQRITWAEAAGRQEATMADMRQRFAAADRQWAADENAANAAESGSLLAAGSAIAQWSQQQELIRRATRPVVTSCMGTRIGETCVSE
jgi:hypothetical protein